MMQSLRGKLYLTCAFALAGTSVITGYLLSEKVSVFTITMISMGIVLVGLFPVYGRLTIRTARLLTGHDWLLLFFQALFGIFLFRMFLLFGVAFTSTAEAGVLTGATPAVTSLLAFWILKERPSGITVAGIGCTVAGIVLLQGNRLFSVQFSVSHLLGNALVLCAAASESTFNILSRKHQGSEYRRSAVMIHPMVQTLLVCGFAFCLSAIPAILEHPWSSLKTLGLQEWAAFVWYGLFVTAAAFGFFYAGAKRCNAYTIAAFSGVMPLSAGLLSILVLRERATVFQWIAGILIILGILLIGRKNRRTA